MQIPPELSAAPAPSGRATPTRGSGDAFAALYDGAGTARPAQAPEAPGADPETGAARDPEAPEPEAPTGIAVAEEESTPEGGTPGEEGGTPGEEVAPPEVAPLPPGWSRADGAAPRTGGADAESALHPPAPATGDRGAQARALPQADAAGTPRGAEGSADAPRGVAAPAPDADTPPAPASPGTPGAPQSVAAAARAIPADATPPRAVPVADPGVPLAGDGTPPPADAPGDPLHPPVPNAAAAQAGAVLPRATAEPAARQPARPGAVVTAPQGATPPATAEITPPVGAMPAQMGPLMPPVEAAGLGGEAGFGTIRTDAGASAPVSLASVSLAPAAAPGAPMAPAGAPAPPVAGQLALAARSLPDGPVEIALSPPELGRVTLTLTASEASISVALLAERGETLDLLRRSIGLLADELRALGYDNPTFSFGGDAGGRDRGPRPERASGYGLVDAVPAAATAPAARAIQGLDLRL